MELTNYATTPVVPSQASAKILAKSVGVRRTEHGLRHEEGSILTTFQITFARSALAELNTHRVFSRNSASSRAIPVQKMLNQVISQPYIPRRYSKTQKGMNASEFVDYDKNRDEWLETTLTWWLPARDSAVQFARRGLEIGIHKQDVNRLLEPFMMHTVILSSTQWGNFYNLRLALDENSNPLAYLPIYELAKAMQEEDRKKTIPDVLFDRDLGPFSGTLQWHLPLVGFDGDENLTYDERIKVSVARIGRVSYLTHEGTRNPEADLALYESFKKNMHLSPFEHVAHPYLGDRQAGNFKNWRQLRYYVERNLV